MRSIAIIGLILWPSCPALGQTTDRLRLQSLALASGEQTLGPMRRHRPSQAEGEKCDSERLGAGARAEGAPSAYGENEQIKARFLAACMTRLHLDEPLGGEQRHQGLCMRRIDAPTTWNSPGGLAATAVNIETRNAGNAIIPSIPAITRRSNEAATQACMNELSR